MFVFFTFIFLIIFFTCIFYTAKAWIELDRWIADAPNREANGYREYVNNPTPTPKPEPKMIESVSILTANVENFPKTPEEAKKKIEELLKKVQKSA